MGYFLWSYRLLVIFQYFTGIQNTAKDEYQSWIQQRTYTLQFLLLVRSDTCLVDLVHLCTDFIHTYFILFFDRSDTQLYRKPILTGAAEKQKKDRTKTQAPRKVLGNPTYKKAPKQTKEPNSQTRRSCKASYRSQASSNPSYLLPEILQPAHFIFRITSSIILTSSAFNTIFHFCR